MPGSRIHKSASLLVSRKVARGDPYTEGSGTTNAGTDVQKLHMRLIWEGKAAHRANAYKQQSHFSRCSRDWQKDNALTGGGLPNHGMDWEKSAESIVANGNELQTEIAEVSQVSEGRNVERLCNIVRKFLRYCETAGRT